MKTLVGCWINLLSTPVPNNLPLLSWSNGLVVVWDNRCVQHKAMNDYKGQRREIHRTMVCDHQKPS